MFISKWFKNLRTGGLTGWAEINDKKCPKKGMPGDAGVGPYSVVMSLPCMGDKLPLAIKSYRGKTYTYLTAHDAEHLYLFLKKHFIPTYRRALKGGPVDS